MIHVAIIGTGAIAPSHIKGYLQFSERYKIIAVCDPDIEKAQKTVKAFGLSAEVYSDYQELARLPELDLVSVCTPPYTHAPISIDFLQQGKHVLVEKPMASSLEECDEMNKAAETSGKILSVVAQNRFRTAMMKMKAILDKNVIGQVLHTQVDSFWWRGHSYYDLWWRGTWEKEGGGCTLNHAVHHIDIFQWMNGLPAEITAVTSNTAHDNAEVEDLSIAIGRYQNGTLAQITSSVVHHGEEQQLTFQGKNARISFPWKVVASQSKENGFPLQDAELEEAVQSEYNRLPALEFEGHSGQIHDMLTSIEEGKQVLVDGKQGRQTLELIMAIYQSATLQKTVQLPLTKKDPFYTRKGIMQHAPRFYEKTTAVQGFDDNSITT
ncbi:gfo/Idh/MocA family oxidoreductase [Sediminibacillus dalangtanensis]|uniref:Gfo/Idh/MocA family oxidoreductase n=1 Tax=Sediminibacillus dalangtanensis TaxID=2729421 RepID=A0ABX7VXV1_9BACI|nr:Gfo/Idh/MocA family oxidoreductase [Sediminibacillus dalangtanensis]QTN00476.1 gfo/Idh/MocA family oxidoreductase [Sediminibacillus dalangtanensis]